MFIIISCGITESDKQLEKDAVISEVLDTLELMYVAYACDCQKWVIEHDYEAYYRGERGQGVFDLDQYGYYIEPGIPGMKEIPYSGRIRFYGKLRSNNDWPADADFIDDDPPKGKVLTYYHFEKLLEKKQICNQIR